MDEVLGDSLSSMQTTGLIIRGLETYEGNAKTR